MREAAPSKAVRPRRRGRGPGRPAGASGQEGREALLRATRELLAELGFARVTSRAVAERAGVQPALVNYYFGDKRGLLRAVVEQIASELMSRVEEVARRPGGVEERLRHMIHATMEIYAREPYAPRLVMEQILFSDDETTDLFVDRFAKPNLATVRALLEDGRHRGEIRSVDALFLMPSLLGSCIFFFLATPVLRRLFDIEEVTPELAGRYADHVIDLVMRGISIPEGSSA